MTSTRNAAVVSERAGNNKQGRFEGARKAVGDVGGVCDVSRGVDPNAEVVLEIR